MREKIKRLLATVTAIAATVVFAAGCSESVDTSSKKDKETTSSTTTAAPDDGSDSSDGEGEGEGEGEKQPASDITPAMWKLETPSGAIVYFMGSMHALPDDAMPFPEEIMEAYNSSEAIAVECDVVAFANDFNAQIALSEDLMYTDGTTIKDHIDAEVYDKLVKQMKDWDIYMAAYDYFKPAMWQSLCENYLLENSDIKAENSFDEYFLKEAKKDGKEIIEVESVDFQMDLLINFSDDINNLILSSYTETTVDEYVSELEALYGLWATGDYVAIADSDEVDEGEFTAEELEIYYEYDRQMMVDRNKVMADKLIELSKGDKDVFYYVGAAHFGDDDGILKLLDDAGVEYERVEY